MENETVNLIMAITFAVCYLIMGVLMCLDRWINSVQVNWTRMILLWPFAMWEDEENEENYD